MSNNLEKDIQKIIHDKLQEKASREASLIFSSTANDNPKSNLTLEDLEHKMEYIKRMLPRYPLNKDPFNHLSSYPLIKSDYPFLIKNDGIIVNPFDDFS